MGRTVRGLLLCLLLLASVVWLVVSVRGLVQSATAFHLRVLDPVRLGTVRATPQEATALQSSQNNWGQSTMFAVAGVASTLVLLFVNTFLRGARSRLPGREI